MVKGQQLAWQHHVNDPIAAGGRNKPTMSKAVNHWWQKHQKQNELVRIYSSCLLSYLPLLLFLLNQIYKLIVVVLREYCDAVRYYLAAPGNDNRITMTCGKMYWPLWRHNDHNNIGWQRLKLTLTHIHHCHREIWHKVSCCNRWKLKLLLHLWYRHQHHPIVNSLGLISPKARLTSKAINYHVATRT